MNNVTPMFDPPHPGEFIAEVYLDPSGMSGRELAGKLGVTPSTLQRLLRGSHGVSPEMALRLSVVLGRSAESWLALQDAYDLWQARQALDVSSLEPLVLDNVGA
jgi:addiction module HigA family antidote